MILNALRRAYHRHRAQPNPMDGEDHAAVLKAEGRVKMGEDCFISPRAMIADPDMLVMGDNVRLSDCRIFAHDGTVNMINRMLGTALDSVTPVTIGNNVAIGDGVTILAGSVIGDNTIVGAGSVVRGTLEGGFVYIGNPIMVASPIGDHIQRLLSKNHRLSSEWKALLEERGPNFSAALEPKLLAARHRHYEDHPFGRQLKRLTHREVKEMTDMDYHNRFYG